MWNNSIDVRPLDLATYSWISLLYKCMFLKSYLCNILKAVLIVILYCISQVVRSRYSWFLHMRFVSSFLVGIFCSPCLVPPPTTSKHPRFTRFTYRPEASPPSSGSSSSIESVTLPVGEKETIDRAAAAGSMINAAATSDDTGDDEGLPSSSGYGVALSGDDAQLDSG